MIPNVITLLRFPLALAFLQENTAIRLIALILAMLSDGLDGFIARRYRCTSRFGTTVDPLADKFFVIFLLIVLLIENALGPWEAVSMLSRDFAVIIFGFYLRWKGTLSEYQYRAIWCGKITTTLQFAVLIALTVHLDVPAFVYMVFVLLGIAALVELYLERSKLKVHDLE